jgi:hypothetical protein
MSITLGSTIIDFTSEYAKEHILAEGTKHQSKGPNMDQIGDILDKLSSSSSIGAKKSVSVLTRASSLDTDDSNTSKQENNAKDVLFSLIENSNSNYPTEERMLTFVKENIPNLENFLISLKPRNKWSQDHIFCGNAKVDSELAALDKKLMQGEDFSN